MGPCSVCVDTSVRAQATAHRRHRTEGDGTAASLWQTATSHGSSTLQTPSSDGSYRDTKEKRKKEDKKRESKEDREDMVNR